MGLTGKTKTYNPTPAGIQQLQGSILDYLLGSPSNPAAGSGANPLYASLFAGKGPRVGGVGIGGILNQQQIPVYNPDNSFFMNNILKPYQDLFAAQQAGSLAAAKEQAGNLTGSGYNNLFGSALAQAQAQQNAQLAQTMMGLRQQDIGQHLAYDQLNQQRLGQNAGNILSLIGALNPAGFANQQQYQPGFLDYALKGVTAAAPFLGTGGFSGVLRGIGGIFGGGGGGGLQPTPPFIGAPVP